MTIRDLKTFLAVVDHGSFVAAAEKVARTQSAVTLQVRKLEADLGYELFDRSKRPPTLNEAGRALIPMARDTVRSYENLLRERKLPGPAGTLRLGVIPSVITSIMPKALVALRKLHPSLHIDVVMSVSAELVERVEKHNIDAAIVSEFDEKLSPLSWLPFAREPLIIVVPHDGPDTFSEDIFAAFPFIRYARHTWVGALIEEIINKYRWPVREAMTLDTIEAVMTMVHHGLGVSIVPLCNFEQGATKVRTLALPGPAYFRTIGIVHKAETTKMEPINLLLAELKSLSQRPISG